MQRILLAASVAADQPWVADAAAELARDTGAEIVVLCVDELEMEALATLPRSEFHARAERAAASAAERLAHAGVHARWEVRPGRPVDQILAFAEECDVDLVVVGAGGRGRLARRLLGSVSLDLVRRAQRPVLMVTAPHEAR